MDYDLGYLALEQKTHATYRDNPFASRMSPMS
jgi:hypothetical protein